MKYILFFFSLISLSFCTTRKETQGVVADIYKGLKSKIYKCVYESENISPQLKELTSNSSNFEENLPLAFNTIELTQDDRKAIRTCKKKAFIRSNS